MIAVPMPLETFLTRSFLCVERDAPAAIAALAEHLGDRITAITVDGEHAHLQCAQRGEPSSEMIVSSKPLGPPAAEVTTSRASLRALVCGSLTLEGAVISDSLRLRGALDDVVAFHDGLLDFARGCARSRGFSALLDAFLSDTGQEAVVT